VNFAKIRFLNFPLFIPGRVMWRMQSTPKNALADGITMVAIVEEPVV
jgi:hypothetical protein